MPSAALENSLAEVRRLIDRLRRAENTPETTQTLKTLETAARAMEEAKWELIRLERKVKTGYPFR